MSKCFLGICDDIVGLDVYAILSCLYKSGLWNTSKNNGQLLEERGKSGMFFQPDDNGNFSTIRLGGSA